MEYIISAELKYIPHELIGQYFEEAWQINKRMILYKHFNIIIITQNNHRNYLMPKFTEYYN